MSSVVAMRFNVLAAFWISSLPCVEQLHWSGGSVAEVRIEVREGITNFERGGGGGRGEEMA